MLRVRSANVWHIRKPRIVNSISSSLRPFHQPTVGQPEPAADVVFWTPETKENWLIEEYITFHEIAYKSWIGITAWSLFWWLIWCNFIMYFSLIMVSAERESTKLNLPIHLGIAQTGSVAEIYQQVIKAREYLEEVCYRRILDSRKYLVDIQQYFKGYAFAVVLSCLTYNFYMGQQVGLKEQQNLILSAKRLLRRRGFAWHALALGYAYVLHGTVEAYYDTYILTPQLRGLSLQGENKRDLFSAYGGKGLALNRIMKEGDADEIHYDIQSNELLCALAKQVAMHRTVRPVRTSIVPVQSALFTSNWGFKYRSGKLNDHIPERCWFREPHIAVAYQTALRTQGEQEKKDEAKRQRQQERKAKQVKREASTGTKKPEQKKEAGYNDYQNDKDAQAAQQARQKFQVGKCFGGSNKEDRFLKAARLEINKAVVARLGVVDLLVGVNTVTEKVKSADSYLDSMLTSLEYLSLIGKFTENRRHIEIVKCQAKQNHEQYCLCNYYPYYAGYFA